MLDKTRIVNILSELEEVANRHNFEKLLEDIRTTINEVNEYKIKALFVGSFNAGKSALINSIIKRDILEENIVPETDIATELIFGENEQVLLTSNVTTISCSIDKIKDYKPKDFSKYCYVLNSGVLHQMSDYVMVDMPGFDSGIEDHNKALMQYIDKGSIYILVIDCEKGGISDSVMSFLDEIKNYSNNIGVILTKCDKRTKSEVEGIENNIRKQVHDIIGYYPIMLSTSKFDEEVNESTKKLLMSFDIQTIFENKFKQQISDVVSKVKRALTLVIESLNFDSTQIDKDISLRERSKKILSDKLVLEKKKLSSKLKNQVKYNILNDVSNALVARATELSVSAQSGGHTFSNAVNSIIRPVLIESTERNIDITFNEFVEDIQIGNLGEFDAKEIENLISGIFKKLTEISSKSESHNGLYKSVLTVLAITTTAVAPWLEIVLIFLPEILQLLGGIVKTSQTEMVRNKIVFEIIPQIITKLEPEIQNSLIEVEQQMLKEIEIQFDELVSIEIEALENLKSQKNSEQLNIQSMRKMIESDLTFIEASNF